MSQYRFVSNLGRVGAYLLVAIGIAGCAGGNSVHVPNTASPELPVEKLRLSNSEADLAARASAILETACLRKAEFKNILVPPAAVDVPRRHDDSRRYGLTDPGAAAKYGYHLPPDPPDVLRRETSASKWFHDQPATVLEALTKPGGCGSAAQKELSRGGPNVDQSVLADIDYKSLEDSQKDPAVVHAVTSWTQCMTAAGYTYRSPDVALADPRWNLDSAAPSALERRTAGADVRCKELSGLLTTWRAKDSAQQAQLLAENVTRIAQLRRAKSLYLANCRDIIGS